MTTKESLTPWQELAKEFPTDRISLLPRATGKAENRKKQSCKECGGYHDFPCIHLSYVGHADITDRLNEVDPTWTWEPMGLTATGLPALDAQGGLWAWLTILGVRKPAYGDPGLNYKNTSKAGTPDGMKEAIGDMLRNGAMRFGVGTYLWSKSDSAKDALVRGIQGDDDDAPEPPAAKPAPAAEPKPAKTDPQVAIFKELMTTAKENGKLERVKKHLGDPANAKAAQAAYLALDAAGKDALMNLAASAD